MLVCWSNSSLSSLMDSTVPKVRGPRSSGLVPVMFRAPIDSSHKQWWLIIPTNGCTWVYMVLRGAMWVLFIGVQKGNILSVLLLEYRSSASRTKNKLWKLRGFDRAPYLHKRRHLRILKKPGSTAVPEKLPVYQSRIPEINILIWLYLTTYL